LETRAKIPIVSLETYVWLLDLTELEARLAALEAERRPTISTRRLRPRLERLEDKGWFERIQSEPPVHPF
jgi:hypothetical protein